MSLHAVSLAGIIQKFDPFLAVRCGVVSFVVRYVVSRDLLNGDEPIEVVKFDSSILLRRNDSF